MRIIFNLKENKMKLCINCKHCRKNAVNDYICIRKISPVDGGLLPLSCDSERSYYNGLIYDERPTFCGMDAFYFEQKAPE